MAITHTANTYSSGSAIAAGLSLQTTIVGALIAKAGWTLVEDFTPGTINWSVVKLAAATSGALSDIYVVIGRVTATGALFLYAGETYNTGTKVLGKFCAYTNSTARAAAADRTLTTTADVAVTFTLGATTPPSSINQTPYHAAYLPAASGRYLISVDNDHAVIAFSTASAAAPFAYYVGLVESLVTNAVVNDPMPLVTCDLASSNLAQGGGSSRHPMIAPGVSISSIFSLAGLGGSAGWQTMGAEGGSRATSGYQGYTAPDIFNGNVAVATRLLCTMGFGVGAANLTGRFRGVYKTIRGVQLMAAGAVFGDTVAVDGKVHACIYSGANQVLVDTGVAV